MWRGVYGLHILNPSGSFFLKQLSMIRRFSSSNCSARLMWDILMAIRNAEDQSLRTLPAHCTRLAMKSFILHPAFAPKNESAGGGGWMVESFVDCRGYVNVVDFSVGSSSKPPRTCHLGLQSHRSVCLSVSLKHV